MICKWCGAPVDVKQGKCPACGSEIPPLSDCGGFYDVVPKAARPMPAPQPEEKPPVPVQVPQPKYATPQPVAPPPPQGKKRRGAAAGLPVLVCLALTVAVGAFSVVRTAALSKRVDELQAQNENLQQAVAQLQKAQATAGSRLTALESPPATEPPEAEPPLAGLTTRFAVALRGGKPIEPAGEVQGLGELEYLSRGDWVVCNLDGEYLWEASLTETSGETEEGKTFLFQYQAEQEQFGAYRDASFAWEYRLAGAEDWQAPEEDDGVQITHQNGEAKSTLTVSADWLAQRSGDYELRCTVTRSSRSGGSLTIEFEIFVPAAESGKVHQ